MATPHLTSHSASSAANRHLNGTGSHLLIVRKSSAWTNKELVLRPVARWFDACVTYAETTTYNTTGSAVVTDGVMLANNAISQWRTRNASSCWKTGARSIFAYYQRAGGLWRRNNEIGNLSKGIEIGSTRVLYQLNAKHFPSGMASSFKTFLRIYNASALICNSTVAGAVCNSTFWTQCGVQNLAWKVSGSIFSPDDVVQSGSRISIFGCRPNNGNYSSTQELPVSDFDYACFWNPRNSEEGLPDGYWSQAVYDDGTQYYQDVEIDSASLKSAIDATGGFYIGLGFVIGNGFGYGNNSLTGTTSLTNYINHVEVVFKVTMAKFN